MLNDDDMVAFDYDLYVGGKLYDTTVKATAEKHKTVRQSRSFQPVLFTVGIGQIVQGLEEHMREHAEVSIGKPDGDHLNGCTDTDDGSLECICDTGPFVVKTTIPAEKGFGRRGKDLLKSVPIARFRGQKVEIGTRVNMDGREGIVCRLGGGRAVVDLHHELADRELEYHYTVRAIHRDPQPKTEAILRQALGPAVVLAWETADEVPTVRAEVPDTAVHNPQWARGRVGIVQAIRHAFVGKPVRVVFVEAYNPPPPAPPVVLAPEEPTQTTPEAP